MIDRSLLTEEEEKFAQRIDDIETSLASLIREYEASRSRKIGYEEYEACGSRVVDLLNEAHATLLDAYTEWKAGEDLDEDE